MHQDLKFIEALFWTLFVWNSLTTIALIFLFSMVASRCRPDPKLQPSATPCGHCPVMAHQLDTIKEAHKIVTETLTNKPPKNT